VIPQPILAWPLVGSQLLIFGTTAFALLAAPRDVVTGDVSKRSLVVLWRVLALIVLVMSPLRLLSVAAGMADSTFREVLPSMPQIMRETFAGRVWTWRLATALLLALVAWIPVPGRLATALMFVISAALLGFQSVTSHAVDKGVFAISIHFAHQVAAGMWIGALVSLLIGATYGHAGADWLRSATSRVSTIAGWSVAALIVTGLIRAWEALGLQLDLLVNSIYGRTLLWKVGTAASVILIGGYNRYRLVGSVGESSARAALIRNVAVECALLAVVLGWSVVLANSPPPH
jgi:putative copper export protein